MEAYEFHLIIKNHIMPVQKDGELYWTHTEPYDLNKYRNGKAYILDMNKLYILYHEACETFYGLHTLMSSESIVVNLEPGMIFNNGTIEIVMELHIGIEKIDY